MVEPMGRQKDPIVAIGEFLSKWAKGAPLTDTTHATDAKTDAFGLQECFIKGGEVQALSTVFLVGDIATCTD